MAQNQAYLFLVFSLTGIVIGILFDFFRILRRSIKTSNIVTYIQDILFWILAGIIVLYSIWYFNNGELRTYVFLGLIIGILIYMTTLSNIIVKIFTKFLVFLINVFKIPLKAIYLFISKIFTITTVFFNKITKKLKIKKGNFVKNGE